MRFRTKGELLEYLGLDKKYVRKVDRMMVKGEVSIVDGEYEYEDKAVELEKEVERLQKELAMYVECYEKNAEDYNELLHKYQDLESSVNTNENTWQNTTSNTDELSDLDFQIQENERLYDNRDTALRKCYDFMVGKKIFNPETNPYAAFFEWATGEEYES